MLFHLPEKKQNKEVAGGSVELKGSHQLPHSKKLEDVLSLVKKGRCVHWVTEGAWNMHDMLLALLNYTGPASVFISSYAFTEFPARLIADLINEKVITDLKCIIDKRIDVRSASALNIIRNMASKFALINTHAKVTIIENEKYLIAVVGSANYTQNKRFECGVIITDREAALFHKNWMQNALDKN